MIDSHCHLTDPRLRQQLHDVLLRALRAGVDRMITIGTDIEDDRAAIALCESTPQLRCAVGIHPNYSADARVEHVQHLDELQKHPSVVALGEMGLDYHYDRSPRAHQKDIFLAQLELASKLSRPVVIHCREAVDDTLAILRQFPNVPAVFHCFTGSPDEADRIIAAGHYIGYTGPVTYKTNHVLREAVRRTPLDRMLVETDAPYLSPEPVRSQKTNEPSFVIHTAASIARTKELPVEEIDRITTANTERFFRWS